MRNSQMRKSTRHGANHMNTMVSPMPIGACGSHANHREQGPRESRCNQVEGDDDHQDCERDIESREMRIAEVLEREQQLAEKSVTTFFNSEHVVQLPQRHLHAHSRKKPH